MENEAEEIGEIAKVYHELLVERANLNRADVEGPNAIHAETRAARRLLTELLPRYRHIVPPEVQRYLDVDLDGLEKICGAYRR